VRISEILHSNKKSTSRHRACPQVGSHSGKNLTLLAKDCTKEGRHKHFHYLNWSRAFLSKTRYMAGRQCPKKLWQTVYDPEPAQEPLPGTVKGMGIEVGIKARLLWPGGVLIDTLDSAEAIRRTIAVISFKVGMIIEIIANRYCEPSPRTGCRRVIWGISHNGTIGA
jgi:hypothetical protein